MLAFVRRQWREAVADWRKAPVCFSVGGAFGAAGVLAGATMFCWIWWMPELFLSVAERLRPGAEPLANVGLLIDCWLYSVSGLFFGSTAFFAAGVWRAYRKVRRDAAGRKTAPPDESGGQVQEWGSTWRDGPSP